MRRRRWPWLLAAVVLLGLAVFLMSRDDPKQPEPVWKRVVLPRTMNSSEHARAEQRRTMAVAPPVAATEVDAGQRAATPPRPRDPVLAALPSTIEHGVVVVEANAIRHSPVGELLIDCLTSRDGGRGLARMRERTGIDPLEDLDRVAIADDALVLSGNFKKAKWAELFPGDARAWGHEGTIYENVSKGRADGAVGAWGDQMLVVADDANQVEAVLDRIEDRGIQGPPVLDESQTYGDIYGVLTAKGLAELLPDDQAALAEKLQTLADRVELHVDATRDVGVVARITGPNGGDTKDLGKTMGAALALARLKAQADGETELAELMDLARVVPGDGAFNVEMGLPLEVLQKHLEKCVADNRARRADAGN